MACKTQIKKRLLDLEGIRFFDRDVFYKNRKLPYDEFIHKLLACYSVEPQRMDQMEYPGDQLRISVIMFDDSTEENTEDDVKCEYYTLSNAGGFTAGRLLYEMAKVLPKPNSDEPDDHEFAYLDWSEIDNSYLINNYGSFY